MFLKYDTDLNLSDNLSLDNLSLDNLSDNHR